MYGTNEIDYCWLVAPLEWSFGYVVDEQGYSLVIGVELSVVERFELFVVDVLEVLS